MQDSLSLPDLILAGVNHGAELVGQVLLWLLAWPEEIFGKKKNLTSFSHSLLPAPASAQDSAFCSRLDRKLARHQHAYSAARNPPPLSSLRSETGAVPRLGGGCTQAACFFSISSAAGSTSTASCCFPLRVLVGFCKSSALTASRACVCGILQVRSTVNCSRHHHAR